MDKRLVIVFGESHNSVELVMNSRGNRGKSIFVQYTGRTNYKEMTEKLITKEFDMIIIDEQITAVEINGMTKQEIQDKDEQLEKIMEQEKNEPTFDRRLVYNQIKKQRFNTKPNFKTKYFRRKF